MDNMIIDSDLVNSADMVTRAWQQHRGIGAFNVNDLEWAKSIILGAAGFDPETGKQPGRDIILQVTMGAADYMGGYKLARDMIVDLIDWDKDHGLIPKSWRTVLHADHADYDHASKALEAGFTSVMFDGSKLPIDENVRLSKIIIERAHQYGATAEVEVGTIGGSEDGVYGSGELSPFEEVLRMAALRPDMMAVGVGNIHGPYPKDWTGLDFDYLSTVKKGLQDNAIDLPLVLHGGSGIPDDQVARAIMNGVTKINVNTELQLEYYNALRAEFRQLAGYGEDHIINEKLYDPRTLLSAPAQAIAGKVRSMTGFFNDPNLKEE